MPENQPGRSAQAPSEPPYSDPAAPPPGAPPTALAAPGANPVAVLQRPLRRRAHWPIVLLRTLSFVVLVQVLLQAVLAGGFITGNVNFLGLHSANAIFLVLTSMALLPAAVLLLRPGRGPWWPILFSAVLWFLIAVQVGFGFSRQVGLHIPLGMTIMGLISGFTWWTCAYRTKR